MPRTSSVPPRQTSSAPPRQTSPTTDTRQTRGPDNSGKTNGSQGGLSSDQEKVFDSILSARASAIDQTLQMAKKEIEKKQKKKGDDDDGDE